MTRTIKAGMNCPVPNFARPHVDAVSLKPAMRRLIVGLVYGHGRLGSLNLL